MAKLRNLQNVPDQALHFIMNFESATISQFLWVIATMFFLETLFVQKGFRPRKMAALAIQLLCISLCSNSALAQDTLWKTYYAEGLKAQQASDSETAEKMFLSAAEQAQSFGESDQRYYQTLDTLAITYELRRNFDEAEMTFQKVLALKEKALGSDSPQVAATMSNYADLLFLEGKLKQAEIMYQTSLPAVSALSPAGYAEKMQNYGMCLGEEGLYAKAEEALLTAREKEVALYGENAPQVLTTEINLINTRYKKGAYQQAEDEANQVLQKLNQSGTPDQKTLDACLGALSQIDLRMGHFAKAEE